ncbi:WD40/YVTN/BNR-like repeat-containing protein [Microbispora rosea]|uniref:WD40/YVTN/BNR-like repeat-containing protein n=1 Tax=Microbispora rosea TaxID=58117 RepID=UPI003791EE47
MNRKSPQERIVLAAGLGVVLAVAAATSATTAAAATGTVAAGTVAAPAVATSAANTASLSHWQSMGPNASGGHLAFTPAAPSRLYVLPDAGYSVFRSDDHGLTWRQPGWLGVPDASGLRLAADPRDADVVWVAATVLGTGQGHVLRSDDGAETFHSVLDSPTDITDVVVSPTGRQVFAAGTAGVYESLDQGAHWTLLPGSPGQVSRLALSGNDLFAGAGSALYLIEDALTNPQAARKLPLPGDVFVQHLAARDGLVVASQTRDGSAVISTDNGRSWRTLTGPWGTDFVLFIALTASGEIQVQASQAAADGTSAGRNLWISPDQGRTWTPRPNAFTAVDLYTDLGSFPDRPDEEVVTGPAGTFTTRDSASYQRIGVPAVEVDALAVSGPMLVAGTTVDSYGSRAPLSEKLKTGFQDWGWTGRSPAAVGNAIGALATLPARGLLRARNAFCPDSCIALERSSDGGAHWRTLTFVGGTSRSLAVDPRHPSPVYVAASFYGFYSSTDGGKTLQQHFLPGVEGVRSVAIDPRADGSLWIGDVTGLYLSRDSGATADKVLTGEVERVAVDPEDPEHIVVVGDNLIKVSHDGGASFSDAVGFTAASYDDVAFAPDGTVFAASGDAASGPGQGLARSVDGGAHWVDVSADLPDRDVRSVLVSPDGGWLFAGTGHSGVYRLAL